MNYSKVLFFVLIFSFNLFSAESSFKLFLDCATTDHHFDCFEIRETLKLKLLNGDKLVTAASESNINLKIRTREVEDGTIPTIFVEQYFQRSSESTPFLFEIKEYRESDFNATTTMDLVNHLVVQLVRLRGVTTLEQTDKGVVVTFGKSDDSGSGQSQNPDIKDWYLQPSGSLNWNNSLGESSSTEVYVGGEYVKAKEKNKLILRVHSSYVRQLIEFSDGKTDEYEEVGLGLSTFYVRTLKNNKWSVAIFTNTSANPIRDNINLRQQVSVGVEYNMVPFITKTEERVFTVRYAIGPDYYRLKEVNFNDDKQVVLLKHGVEIGSKFILNKYNKNNLPLSVGFNFGAGSEVKGFRYAQLFGATNITYNITEGISLTPYYSINFSKGYVNQPKSQTGGVIGEVNNAGRFAQTQHTFFVTLAFSFGSRGLKNKDTRWQ
jgi:hypothetical protein